MSDGYGVCKWTCGECGDSYEASGVVGESKVDRWMRDHQKKHRVEKMTPEERKAHYNLESQALLAWYKFAEEDSA